MSTERIYKQQLHFQKPLNRKWTWKAPDGTVKNEIDYVMTTRSDIVKEVKVITKANVGSDYHLVASKIKIDTYVERRRMVKRKNYIDKDALHHLSKDFEQQLSNRFHLLTLENDIDDHTSNIVDIIKITSTTLACCQRTSKRQKLSPDTKLSIKKQRE